MKKIEDNVFSYETEVLNIEGKSFKTGDTAYAEVCQIIESGMALDKVYEYCKTKSADKNLTVKSTLLTAILNYTKPNETGEDKFKAYNIAMKIQAEGELTSEDKVVLKEAVGAVWKKEIVGFIWNLIK
jgi:thymidine phosphorylase